MKCDSIVPRAVSGSESLRPRSVVRRRPHSRSRLPRRRSPRGVEPASSAMTACGPRCHSSASTRRAASCRFASSIPAREVVQPVLLDARPRNENEASVFDRLRAVLRCGSPRARRGIDRAASPDPAAPPACAPGRASRLALPRGRRVARADDRRAPIGDEHRRPSSTIQLTAKGAHDCATDCELQAEDLGVAVGEDPHQLVVEVVRRLADVVGDPLVVHLAAAVDVFLQPLVQVAGSCGPTSTFASL